MSRPIAKRGTLALAAAAALIVAAFASVPAAQASTLYACVTKSGGAHLYTKKPKKCKSKKEKLVSWNTVGPAGSNGAGGAQGKEGKEGTAGKPGLDGTAVAYAEVSNLGKLGGNSKGIAKMTPGATPAEGVYCLKIEPSPLHVGIAGLGFLGGSAPGFAEVDMAPLFEVIFEDCSSETTVAVHTYNAKGEAAAEGFFAIFD